MVIVSDCDCVRTRIYSYNNIRNHYKRNTRIINSRRARVSRRAGSVFPQFRTPLPRELNLASDIMIHIPGTYIRRIMVRQTYIILLYIHYNIIGSDNVQTNRVTTFRKSQTTIFRTFYGWKKKMWRHYYNHYRRTKYYYQLLSLLWLTTKKYHMCTLKYGIMGYITTH